MRRKARSQRDRQAAGPALAHALAGLKGSFRRAGKVEGAIAMRGACPDDQEKGQIDG